MKNMKKAFALLQEDKQESDISRSDGSDDSDDSEGASHFQFHGPDHFQFVQKAVTLSEQPLDPRIERLFKQATVLDHILTPEKLSSYTVSPPLT
jgi:hypothetical protein